MNYQDIVIRVDELGKKYTIKHKNQVRHNTIRDALTNQASTILRWSNPFSISGHIKRALKQNDQKIINDEEFWALKDVSFEIRRGERIGIIGRNGAGKSTLLKILSRITEPTKGRVEISGRVASLLEVGTGFHPELTGKENIYLNGAILGMTRREIKYKFRDIVEFAEVERFLDTPVKRYSSGMYVRLAFSVATHLEPEILIVDEVLAVGDASFQKKSLSRMVEVSQGEGKTILFVSHSMAAISRLCNRSILLEGGRVKIDACTEDAISSYLQSNGNGQALQIFSEIEGSDQPSITHVQILNKCHAVQSEYRVGDSLTIEIGIYTPAPIGRIQVSFIIQRDDGTNIYHCKSIDSTCYIRGEENKRSLVRATFNRLMLYPGTYLVRDVWIATEDGVTLDLKEDTAAFSVSQGSYPNRELQRGAGLIHTDPYWKCS